MTTETVTKSEAGTKAEAGEQVKVASSEDVKTPAEASKVSSEEKIYSQKQLDDFMHMADSEAGRVKKGLETERDEAKSKLEKFEGDIADIQAERDKLQTDIEELTNDDPKKFDLIKRDKELRESQRLLKKATDDLATEQKVNEERVKLANDTLLEISIWEIAAEYEGGDPVKLKDLCSTFTATSEEQVKKVADTIWVKSEKEPQTVAEKEALILDSGKSGGGGEKTQQDRLDERYPTMKRK